jgi:uncharacterized damage-inducible protein DinB
MSLQNVTSRLLRYNLWANQRLVAWLHTVDESLLYQHTGASFGTIDLTLQHMLSAEIYWHTLITTGEITIFNQPVRLNVVQAIMAELVASSERLLNEFLLFTEEQWTQVFRASDSSQSRYEYIIHVVNHGSYHRGQIVTVCRVLKITGEIPVTDYDAYLWWIENS